MIDATTPEQARVNRMKRKGVIPEKKTGKYVDCLKRNRTLEESDLGSQGGSMDTVEHSTGVRKKNGVIKSGGLNSNGGSDIGAHLEIEVVEHSTKLGIKKNDLGPPCNTCPDCGAMLPLLKDAPAFLQTMMDYKGGQQSTKFRRLIRLYNSMFAFTSPGGRKVHDVNKGGGPYVYKIQGSNYHIIGSLFPVGEIPPFAKFYVYDADIEREANLRRNVFVKAPEGNVGSSMKHSGDNEKQC
ncbi:hypothetical protein MKW92_035011 [Papaver armeniacum]|nr:hypothetical protein MKW92_035011 [Papaver armeniacum]